MSHEKKRSIMANAAPLLFLACLAAWIMAFTVTSIKKPVSLGLLAASVFFLVLSMVLNRKTLLPFLTGRRARYGSNLVAVIVILGFIFVAVNYIAARHYKRFDWTSTGRYTLSEKTVRVAEGLKSPLKIITFFSREDVDEEYQSRVTDLLASYRALSLRIEVEQFDQHKDPARAEALAKKYRDTALVNSVVFEYAGRVKSIPKSEMADYDYSGLQYGAPPRMVAFKGEQAFTSAILNVLQESQTRVYFLKGHGEKDIFREDDDGFAAARRLLVQENMDVEELELMKVDRVPDDCDVLIAAGPTHGMPGEEFDKIRDYLEGGGNLLILLDPLTETGYETFLDAYGIALNPGIVIDPSRTMLFASAANLFISNYSDSEITRILRDKGIATSFYLARPVEMKEGERASAIAADEFAMTTGEGWCETDLESEELVYDADMDQGGPVSIALSIMKPLPAEKDKEIDREEILDEEGTGDTGKNGEMKIVVFGDSDFAANPGLGQIGNADILLNSVNWLADKKELISIGPKPPHHVNLSLTNMEMKMILWLTVIGLPGLSMVIGGLVWYARRQ